MGKIAIHGFGRIGRSTLKAALANDLYTPVSISDIKDLETLAVLFAYDTNYGRWPEPVSSHDTAAMTTTIPRNPRIWIAVTTFSFRSFMVPPRRAVPSPRQTYRPVRRRRR